MSAPSAVRPRVTLVKKRLSDGRTCPKCVQAEELLERRGLASRVDEVVWADEGVPDSLGMQLARRYGVETAPFFLLDYAGRVEVETSALRVVKLLAADSAGAGAAEQESASSGARASALDRAWVDAAAGRLANASAEELLDAVLSALGERAVLAFSGAEDVVLIDMAVALGRSFSVLCVDTGRLHPETYRFLERVRKHYGVELRVLSPDFVTVEQLVQKKGLYSFYEDGHAECCALRKVAPLRRALEGYDAWITGQRRDQSPTRAELSPLVWDESYGPLVGGAPRGLVKLSPLASWSLAEVWRYIRERGVPHNELHDRGFVSIGCEPCTRAPRPGEHERAGRWWWEESTRRECGLHG